MSDTFTCTTKELAERTGVDDITAQGLLKFLRVKGIAQEVGERKTASGKGKPAKIYSIPTNLNLSLDVLVKPTTPPAEWALPTDATVEERKEYVEKLELPAE